MKKFIDSQCSYNLTGFLIEIQITFNQNHLKDSVAYKILKKKIYLIILTNSSLLRVELNKTNRWQTLVLKKQGFYKYTETIRDFKITHETPKQHEYVKIIINKIKIKQNKVSSNTNVFKSLFYFPEN